MSEEIYGSSGNVLGVLAGDAEDTKPKPPDPANLRAPVLHEGIWYYPSSWTPDDRTAHGAIVGRRIHEEQLLAATQSKAATAADSPATILAAARLEADAAQRDRESAERAIAGAAAWSQAVEKHGARVVKIDGLAEGDVIVLRAWTAKESDAADRRAEALARNAYKQQGTDDEREARAMADRTGAYKDATLAAVLHPDRERMKVLLDRYPLLAARLYAERDKLIMGVRLDQGKGPAL